MTVEPTTQERPDIDTAPEPTAEDDGTRPRLRGGLLPSRPPVGPAVSTAGERTVSLLAGVHARSAPVAVNAAHQLRDGGRALRTRTGPVVRRGGRAVTGVYATYRARARAVSRGQEEVIERRARGDRRGEAVKLNGLGKTYRKRAQHAEAVVCYTQALAIFRDLHNRRGEGLSLSNLGLAYDDQGNTVKAVRCFQEALAIFSELGDTQIEGQILANLGTTYRRQGHRQRALDTWREALALLVPGTPAHAYLARQLETAA